MAEASESAPNALAAAMQRVRATLAAEDFAACRLHLEQARALEPRAIEIERWQARLAWRENDWDKLVAATRAFLARRSDREMAQLEARALSNLRDWPRAVEAWRRVAALRPDWPEAWTQLARAQWRAGLPHAAARSAAQLRALGDADLRLATARLAIERGQLAEARDLFADLAQSEPEQAEEELRVYERKSDFRAAAVVAAALGSRSDGDKFQRLAVVIARDLVPRAAAAEREGRAEAAYLEYAAMLAVEPENILAQTATKRALKFLQDNAREQYAAGDREAALESYRVILQLKPDDAKALNGLAQIEMAEQRWLSAAEVWDALLAASPEDERALMQKARALDRAQAFAPAIAAWRAVLDADANNSEAHLALAKLMGRIIKAGRQALEEGETIIAAETLLLVQADDARAAELARRLDQVLRRLRKDMRQAYKDRRFDQVVACGLAAIRITRDDADVQRLLAQAAMRTHDFAVAAEAWTRASELAPDLSATAQLNLARCHQRLGDAEAATQVLAKLLHDEPSNEKAIALAKELAAAPPAEPDGMVTL